MQDRVISMLGLAAKAGKIAAGGFSAEESVKSRKARLVLIAEDAKSNTVKKFTDKCTFYKIPFRFYGSKEALGRAIGKDSRACIAIIDRGFAESILKKLPPDSGDESTKLPPVNSDENAKLSPDSGDENAKLPSDSGDERTKFPPDSGGEPAKVPPDSGG